MRVWERGVEKLGLWDRCLCCGSGRLFERLSGQACDVNPPGGRLLVEWEKDTAPI